jgi:hypothetical protein
MVRIREVTGKPDFLDEAIELYGDIMQMKPRRLFSPESLFEEE